MRFNVDDSLATLLIGNGRQLKSMLKLQYLKMVDFAVRERRTSCERKRLAKFAS